MMNMGGSSGVDSGQCFVRNTTYFRIRSLSDGWYGGTRYCSTVHSTRRNPTQFRRDEPALFHQRTLKLCHFLSTFHWSATLFSSPRKWYSEEWRVMLRF